MILELAIQVPGSGPPLVRIDAEERLPERPRGIFVGPAGQRTTEFRQALPPPFPCHFIERSHGPLGAQLHAALHLDQRHEPGVRAGHRSRGVPEAAHPIFAAGQDRLAVGAERDAGHRLRVTETRANGKARICVPHAGGVILASGREELSVGAENDCRYGVRMVKRHSARFRSLGIPDEHEAVLASRRNCIASGRF